MAEGNLMAESSGAMQAHAHNSNGVEGAAGGCESKNCQSGNCKSTATVSNQSVPLPPALDAAAATAPVEIELDG